MTLRELEDKLRETYDGNERDFGPMEVRVAVGRFDAPLHDIVFRSWKCVLCDEPCARESLR